MIEWMRFINFRVLRDALLPMDRLTVIVGPNGSGKSTVLKAFDVLANRDNLEEKMHVSAGIQSGTAEPPTIEVKFADETAPLRWQTKSTNRSLQNWFARSQVYALNAQDIHKPVHLQRTFELGRSGANLAAVLTSLQDHFPERFDALNQELHRWIPEFNRILFDTPVPGERAFMLRTSEGGHVIRSVDLSQGTLLALAILTLVHLPNPPTLIGLEEPDRGIHPRLLRDVQDALFRLTDPQAHGETRSPVQVVVTTHSPYFVDLFRDHPESIVFAQKEGLYATFKRLVDQPNVEEILRDAHLGDAWYSGVLGGVPTGA